MQCLVSFLTAIIDPVPLNSSSYLNIVLQNALNNKIGIDSKTNPNRVLTERPSEDGYSPGMASLKELYKEDLNKGRIAYNSDYLDLIFRYAPGADGTNREGDLEGFNE